jgi:arylsulfatase A-like enzyme
LDRVDLKFLERSQAFLRDHHREHADKPFFLFHSMQAVHLPSLPAAEFQGKSGAGPHGDFIWEMDWIVGQLMGTLDELGMTENTLVIFCSDNGPEVPSVNAMRRDHQHDGARPWRGMKRDQWEGGHRTPLIVRWPKRVEAGSIARQTVCLTDVFATCADLLGQKLPNDAAEDSFSWWPLMRGELGEQPVRPYTLHQTPRNVLAIRQGDWKYLDHPGSGGNDYSREGAWGLKAYALAAGNEGAPGQLYNLAEDPGETRNLYHEHPEVVTRLKKQLEATVKSGRSAPGR